MRAPRPFDIVLSLAGHDGGKLYVVTGERDGRLLLCDGRTRKIENPKSKSPKHMRLVAEGDVPPATDKDIRRILALAADVAAEKEGKLLGER